MQLNLIFKNSHFVVIDKPAGLLSTPSRFGRSDPRPVAGIILQEQLGTRVFPVHRLDEEVSGLLLFALDAHAHKVANRWFELHEVIKTYEASSIVPPKPSPAREGDVMKWQSKLMRGKKRAYEADFGKDSVTKAKLVFCDAERSIWHLQPLTGRSHQLRFEMAKNGFPIDGDVLYGSTRPSQNNGIGLRAIHLDFRSTNGSEDLGIPPTIVLPSRAPVTEM